MVATVQDATNAVTWAQQLIGGGGYVCGINQLADGTMVIRTDTYGAYYRNTVSNPTGAWRTATAMSSWPASQRYPERNTSPYEIIASPTTPTPTLWMMWYLYAYKSTDLGLTWTQSTGIPTQPTSMNPNDIGGLTRLRQKKGAVDPFNTDHVILTGTGGVYRTTNGGTTWSTIATSSIPLQTDMYSCVIFDYTATADVNGRCPIVYICSCGHGFYKSTDAGVTWAAITGMPTSAMGGDIDALGNLWVVADDGTVYKYTKATTTAATVTNISADNGETVWSVTVDRLYNTNNPGSNRVIVVRSQGGVCQSLNGGTSWGTAIGPDLGNMSLSTPNIPWQNTVAQGGMHLNPGYLDAGQMICDRNVANKLWLTTGIGVWTATLATNASSIVWTENSKGIEQLDGTGAMSTPPAPDTTPGKTFMTAWDRPIWLANLSPTTYPSRYYPNASREIRICTGMDFSSANPKKMFFSVADNLNGVDVPCTYDAATDTWTTLSSPWTGGPGFGSVACASDTNFVWVASGTTRTPKYTTNGGSTWTNCAFSPAPPDQRWWDSIFLSTSRIVVAAERDTVNHPNTFYIWHGNLTTGGIWKSTDGGANFTRVCTGSPVANGVNGAGNGKLKTVYGKSQHLWLSAGYSGNEGDRSSNPSTSCPIKVSIDGGATWTQIPDVYEVYAFGFGTTVAGGNYPSLYIVGYVQTGAAAGLGVSGSPDLGQTSGWEFGVWRCDNIPANPTTTSGWIWKRLTGPASWGIDTSDNPCAIDGDKSTFGTAYIAFTGNSFGVVSVSGQTFSISDASVTEGGNVVFTVSRSGTATGSQTVDYATSNGTATAGVDYTATSGTLTFATSDTSKTVTVPTTDDLVYEGNETFTLTLSNATGGASIATPTATGTIVENDSVPLARKLGLWLRIK